MKYEHSFHIPVMGIGFTLETPMKVSQYGMASAMSLVDDKLIEKVRKFYSEKFELPYQEITNKMEDFRAKRITSYLNLVETIVHKNFDGIIEAIIDKTKGFQKYFDMLPDGEKLLTEYHEFVAKLPSRQDMEQWVKDKLAPGSIDVNIMTKVDKPNYKDGLALSHEYNDAHAALRGFANSELSSSVVLSAGMNPRLYGYLGQFQDFFPNADGRLKKKIILKVSDYRSAIIQGKFLAKKGLWVSEYRIESGLNCGGHAFATEGHLMGPVLAEFKDRKDELISSTFELLTNSLEGMALPAPKIPPSLKITAQGGVGTAEEHRFLLDKYELDSVGWGSPFLLVPEVVTIDNNTLEQLENAGEEDLFLSNISPLGVPFNNLRGNSKDLERDAKIKKGKPGSPCPKKYVSINTEFTEHAICTASREYQHAKLKELNEMDLNPDDLKKQAESVTEKSCICVGLGTGTLLVNDLDTTTEGPGVSVCPGPNVAYFNKSMKLNEITDHIYGRADVISRKDRPHMFIKELSIYMDVLRKKLEEVIFPLNRKDQKYFSSFINNLEAGIAYYEDLFAENKKDNKGINKGILMELKKFKKELSAMAEGML